MIFAAIAAVISLIITYFYGLFGLLYLLAEILLSYLLGILIEKHRFLMWISIALHAAILVFLRLNIIQNLGMVAPIGISYFSLLIISYHADIYRGRYKADRNLLSYILYICYFPRLLMGPIERKDNWDKAMRDRTFSGRGLLIGGTRALWGLFKQIVIAARAATVVSVISAAPEDYKGAYALFAVLLYSIELYADFSGAMDIVIGVSQMLGIKLPENFDRPYFSESVQEFWRRWHMTLGAWLKDYIYIPLGGSRKGNVRKALNTVAVFIVSGFWHGTQYLLWGVLNGIGVLLGDKLKVRSKTVNQIGTFVAITLMWSFFVWSSTEVALSQLASIFSKFNYVEFCNGFFSLGLNLSQWLIFAVGVLILWLHDALRDKITQKFEKHTCMICIFACACILALIIMTFGMYGIGFDSEAFIYSRF